MMGYGYQPPAPPPRNSGRPRTLSILLLAILGGFLGAFVFNRYFSSPASTGTNAGSQELASLRATVTSLERQGDVVPVIPSELDISHVNIESAITRVVE